MAEYVTKEDVIELLTTEDCDKYCHAKMCKYCEYMIDDIEAMKTADVQFVATTENMAVISDEFICKKCGIYLKNYIKVVMNEDNDGYVDEQHYDYEPKFCPECGAKVKEGAKNE